MPVSFDPSQIWNPFVSDDNDDESEANEDTESDDITTNGGTEPVTYGLDTDNVPRVEVTTSSSNGSDDDPHGSVAGWYEDVIENRQQIEASSIEYTGNVEFELSTEAYDDLRDVIREQHSSTFEGHMEQLHQDTSPRQDTLSDAI